MVEGDERHACDDEHADGTVFGIEEGDGGEVGGTFAFGALPELGDGDAGLVFPDERADFVFGDLHGFGEELGHADTRTSDQAAGGILDIDGGVGDPDLAIYEEEDVLVEVIAFAIEETADIAIERGEFGFASGEKSFEFGFGFAEEEGIGV